jgi:uncharacterized protein
MATWHTPPHPNPLPFLLREKHREELEAFLCQDVPLNLFSLSWLENNGVEASHPGIFHFQALRDECGGICASSLVISQRLILLDARTDQAAALLARWYRDRGGRFHHIVSPRRAVEPFWTAYRRSEARSIHDARLIQNQEMYVLTRLAWQQALLRADGPWWEPTALRPAHRGDLDPLFLASAMMHREETLEDPLEKDPDAFRRHVRHRITHGRSFVWFDDTRRLVFKVDLSAFGRYGAQVSGVYTTPSMRGQGLATRAMLDLCHQLFEQGLPLITLYVNDHNESAKTVYTRVGFRYYADYQTVFVAV